ncbi:TRAP transporter small permease [Domibacillus enclensis]|uniref:TRAP transporter small permease protein n=1 Tax=Domibacillus enclensis TaxID=1017273 RepID=A0A1N7C1S4_9BACI|nr:TRAP transporter small permease [Domibacillus enclensis]OXS74200.1 TRAP transporter small permease protein [Domibacillus enclensis]SIR57512.1 TRAP-type C4-dicarboxylate transport system, small permease component [Domibacillus enclensis]
MSEEKKPNIFFSILNKITDVAAATLAAAICLVVVLQIIGREIGTPAPWTEEVTRFLFLWLVFLGIGIGFRQAESARVTILLKYAPVTVKKIGVVIYAVASIAFFAYMMIYGIEMISQQISMGETSAVLLLPMWIIGMCLPLSALIGIINVVQSLLYHRELIEKG